MAGLGDSFMLPKPRPHSETTTILNVGDHPFIQKPSVIFFADARMVDTRLLDAAVRRGAYNAHAAFQARVLLKIQAGLLASTFTPKKIKIAYARYDAAGLT